LTGPSKRILLVEAEENIRRALRYNLVREGFTVSEVTTGEQALLEARQGPTDLILLDLMVPEMGGLEVCRILRQEMRVPIIMVSAKSEEVDKVVSLRMGADDYVTRPFSVPELMARIEALIRRSAVSAAAPAGTSRVERVGSMRLDRDARSVHVGQDELRLSPKEFDLLSFLLLHPGKVQSREVILREVWGGKFFGDPKTIDVHVRWLREKFAKCDALHFRIHTVFGKGYRLDRTDLGAADYHA